MNRIGVYGPGVMGRSLARNIAAHGFSVSVFDRTWSVTRDFVHAYPEISGYETLKSFADSLERPRKIILMVAAGPVVDAVIASLRPLLNIRDILIDCGNSFYYFYIYIQGRCRRSLAACLFNLNRDTPVSSTLGISAFISSYRAA